MKSTRYSSWGRYPDSTRFDQEVYSLVSSDDIKLEFINNKSLLAFGNGRSYGDSCLNDNGRLLDTRGLDRFINFDKDNGILRCEAGVLLSDIINLIMPFGWFLSVTPGTRFITLGGAVANDVHGKNHHCAGSFGCHVRCFELMRSNGERLICSEKENAELFRATIGGIGLTGLIVWAEISLKNIESEYVDVDIICFNNVSEFFALSDESDVDYEYTVAWIDCLAKGDSLGRGVFIRANHNDEATDESYVEKNISFPFELPFSLINKASLIIFNKIYKWSNCRKEGENTQHIYNFFYPLDAIKNWNRIYGKNGFFQYQCVIPKDDAENTIEIILRKISKHGVGSFLAVLKNFGCIESPGMLSFPRYGTTLALDFPNNDVEILNLFNELDELVVASGGAIYPAKDARMSSATFKSTFTAWKEFSKYIDPIFSSSFWRRVTDNKEVV